MHGLFAALSLLANAATGALAAELMIDVTLPVECDRRTQANDKINVHYRGTLQSNGNKFDASMLGGLIVELVWQTTYALMLPRAQVTTEARRSLSPSAKAK